MSHTHFLGQVLGSEFYVTHSDDLASNKNLALRGNAEVILLEMFTFSCHKGCHLVEVLGLSLQSSSGHVKGTLVFVPIDNLSPFFFGRNHMGMEQHRCVLILTCHHLYICISSILYCC